VRLPEVAALLVDLPHMPNSERREFVYLCAVLHVANGYDDHQFAVVARILARGTPIIFPNQDGQMNI
jgi:hypothetical protein